MRAGRALRAKWQDEATTIERVAHDKDGLHAVPTAIGVAVPVDLPAELRQFTDDFRLREEVTYGWATYPTYGLAR